MMLEQYLRKNMAGWLASRQKETLSRLGAEVSRRLRRTDHEILYFHRVDDPYCQLMVQVLPDLMARFNVRVKPLVVERLPANMYPDPARYEAYSILDAMRLARLYGLGFPHTAKVPDRLGVGMASRYLVSKQNSPDFFAIAEDAGAALWREDIAGVKRMCVIADMDDSILIENERLLRRLGHYASGTLMYGGEIYTGLDRMDHLERRLNRLGLGDGEVHYELTRLWQIGLDDIEHSISGKIVDLFFSVRSPYSYIALHTASKFAEEAGVVLKLKPVLPMVMRGLAVPPAKSRYIFADAAREARLSGLPFGRIVDPLGKATERAMAIGFAISDSTQQMAFYKSFTKAVWAEGMDGTQDNNLLKILANAGLERSLLQAALSKDEWHPKAEKNRQEMMISGSWGVPTFRVGSTVLWGQDRLWAVVEALSEKH